MRVESLEPEDTPEARSEYLELAQRLRAEGLEVEVAQPGESVHSVLCEDALHETVAVLNVVLTEAEHVTFVVTAVKGALTLWARGRRHFGLRTDGEPAADIWTPDDEVLERVLLPAAREDHFTDR